MTQRPTHSLLFATLVGMAIGLLAPIAAATMVHAASAPGGDAPIVRLTSVDWPPFSGPQLPNQGLSTAIVERTLTRAGLALMVEFLPWQRAVITGLKTADISGYFPEYRTATSQSRCLLSAAIGSSPLGLAERVNAPVNWRSLTDLTGLRIGTVRGYVNTDAFDQAAAVGQISVEPAVDDATNLRKLAAGRLDMAVIDANVLAYLLASEPDLRLIRDQLRFNARLLEDKSLHVCFRPGEEGEKLRRRFDQALALRGAESLLEAARPATRH